MTDHTNIGGLALAAVFFVTALGIFWPREVDTVPVGLTMGADQTSTTVLHTLGTTPDRVVCSPLGDPDGRDWWVSARGATSFSLAVDATSTNPLAFDCLAVKE